MISNCQQHNSPKIFPGHYYPHQNAHFTIGSGNQDAISEEEYNFWNSNPLLVKGLLYSGKKIVKGLEYTLSGLVGKIRNKVINVPEEWENFFLRMTHRGERPEDWTRENWSPPKSQARATAKATELFGQEGYPPLPKVNFTSVEVTAAGKWVLFVNPDPSQKVRLSAESWEQIWEHVSFIFLRNQVIQKGEEKVVAH